MTSIRLKKNHADIFQEKDVNIKVAKFGGTSLADAEQFKKCAEIIKAEPERKYIVVSAPGKRTKDDDKGDRPLIACAEKRGRKQRNFC